MKWDRYLSNWNGNYKLYVKDGIRTERIKVDLASENQWADFVFAKGYKLPSLDSLEKFIISNGHLPTIPCREEVLNNGIDLVDIQIKLLQKIEELTLYIIKLNKKMEELKVETDECKNTLLK